MRRLLIALIAAISLTWPAAAQLSQSLPGGSTCALGSPGLCAPAPVAAGGCSQATAFLARTSGLNGTHTTAYTNLICGLVSDGIYSSIDVLYIFATQDSTTSLLNVAQNAFNGSVTGTPTFTADSGYLATANGDVITTGFNPTTGTPNFSQNSAHISVWNLTNATNGNAILGNGASGASGESNFFAKFTDNNIYTRINDSANSGGTAIADPRGLLVGTRTSSTNIDKYENNSLLGSVSQASAAPLNASFSVLSISGSISDQAHTIAAVSIGAALNSTQEANFYSRLRTYMTAVGVP